MTLRKRPSGLDAFWLLGATGLLGAVGACNSGQVGATPGGTDSGAGGRAAGSGATITGGASNAEAGAVSTGGSSSGDSSSGGSSSGGADEDGGGSTAPAGACENLPEAGTWENVTPHGSAPKAVNGTVGAAIIVDPFDSRTVWLGTGSENGEIWRSDDCGATWMQVNNGPGSIGDGKTYGGVGDGAQWSMQVDPTEAGVLWAVSGYGAESVWKSIDRGYSWTDMLAGTDYEMHANYRFVNNVSVDPTEHLHVIVSTHGGCTAPYDPSCLAETKDGGKSWRTLKAPEGWAEGGGLVLVKGGDWIWCGSSMMVTTNAGDSWLTGQLQGGGSCEAEYTIRSFVPSANGKYYLGSRNGVLRSKDGLAWEHVPNTSGFMVMIAQGTSRVFAANQWSPSIRSASLSDDETWTDVPAPPQISQGTDGGIPFLAYDDAHHILYASMFSGGVARMVVN